MKKTILLFICLFFFLIIIGCTKEQGLNIDKLTQEEILQKICISNTQDVKISKCKNGEYYTAYPSGFKDLDQYNKYKNNQDTKNVPITQIEDAATNIYNNNGDLIISCWGYRAYVSKEAEAEREKECAKYSSKDCIEIKESCFE